MIEQDRSPSGQDRTGGGLGLQQDISTTGQVCIRTGLTGQVYNRIGLQHQDNMGVGISGLHNTSGHVLRHITAGLHQDMLYTTGHRLCAKT